MTSSTTTWINGKNADTVSAADRGFNYGDGVFETVRVVNGELTLWSYHRSRLANSCGQFGIVLDIELLEKEIQQAIVSLSQPTVIKIIVTRGVGGRGYMPPTQGETTRVITIHEAPQYPAEYANQGIKAHVCEVRISSNSSLAGIKHLNRLEQVLASHELANTNFVEGLMLDERGRVIEGIRTNLFIVKHNTLITPDLSRSGVAGVMRRVILDDLAPTLGIKTEVASIDINMVFDADELFFCNSVNGIWPVNRIDSHTFTVGGITRRLQKEVNQILHL